MDRLISENLILSLFDGKVEQEAPIFSKTITKIIKGLPSAYKGMTNGEVIKAVFPDIPRTLEYHIQNVTDDDWWNSPYEPQESEDKR